MSLVKADAYSKILSYSSVTTLSNFFLKIFAKFNCEIEPLRNSTDFCCRFYENVGLLEFYLKFIYIIINMFNTTYMDLTLVSIFSHVLTAGDGEDDFTDKIVIKMKNH